MTAWPDRYRPDDLEGMALAPDLRQRFERYLSGDVLPRHVILHGPPGFGKTTIATIIAKRLYSGSPPGVMRVKAAETGNVEYVRTTVINFMRSMFAERKLLIFEEASGLSPESLEALRVPLEDWTDLCQVIFLTNDVSKVDEAVRSRCDVIQMTRPPLDECARVLGRALEAEGITVEPATVLGFTRGHFAAVSDDDRRDLRTLLAEAQHHIETSGSLPVPPEPVPGTVLLDLWQGQTPPENAPDGAKLLDELAVQFNKYLVLPKGGVEALTLWTVFAWAHEAFSISPLLALVSPTKGAGKTTALEMLYQLLLLPEGHTLHASNITPAPLYRLKGLSPADQAHASPTPKPPDLCLLLDEADTWLHGEHRGIINSGWKRSGANVPRGGADGGVFSTWYPKALALIDDPASPLPLTIRDRSIIVPMQRKAKGEERERLPGNRPLPELNALREAAQTWVFAHFAPLRDLGGGELLGAADLRDRGPENWHQLMCIAREAGGKWEERARWASLTLAERPRETEQLIDLLRDIKSAFDDEGTDRIRSLALVEKLTGPKGSQWRDARLTAQKLSKMLHPLGIGPRQLWINQKDNKNGYERVQFEDAFSRYL